MDPNYKPVDVRAYTVPRSAKQQLQPSKEIVRLVEIEEEVLEKDYLSECSSPSIVIPRKNINIQQ
jgi:hypothetical protein